MAQEDEKSQEKIPYEVTAEKEGKVLKFNYRDAIHTPSIEDDPFTMSKVIDKLVETGLVNKIKPD
jgi:hypothetical protein